MTSRMIIIEARYVPQSTPTPPVMSSYIARYDYIHPGKPNNTRIILEDDARRLTSALHSWKHSHDFFESFKGQQLVRDFDNSWSRLLMAKKQATSTVFDRPEWKGFLERTMTEQELLDADNLKLRPVDLWEHVDLAIASGFDFSFSYQAKTKTCTVTMKDQRPNSLTAGYALSAKGADAMDAVKLMLYKHEALLASDWNVLLQLPKRPTRG